METVIIIGAFAMALFCTAMLIIGLATYKSVNRNQLDSTEGMARDLSNIFSQLFPSALPIMSVNEKSVEIHGSLSRDHIVDQSSVEAEAYFENKRFLSKKTLSMSGKFKVASGFTADSDLSLTADSRTKDVTISIPNIEILNLKPIGRTNIEASNGWWNGLNDEDHDTTMEMLMKNASEMAEKEGVKEKAETVIGERIRNVLSTRGYRVSIRQEDC